MFRYILFAIFGAIAVFLATAWAINPLHVIIFLALGGLLASTGENEVGYNFIDWLKDHLLSLVGRFHSYSDAKIARLKMLEAAVAGKISAEQLKISRAIKAMR